ncbi:hypothetical protein [Maribacter sp.]|uniref:hypothetical protein n=1 Tax=Maribacter sp. TaxID=1897614 RepID=UPI0025C55F64|nr:hypothetical protein [Maribacter sp.]
MPYKDGWEFLEEFIDLPKYTRNNTQLYIISSFVSPENITKSRKHEVVNGYITKHLTMENIHYICFAHRENKINYDIQENNRQELLADYG